MIKDILAANEAVKPNSREMEVLHKHFAQCFNKEGHFDIEKFQSLIKDEVEITKEGYDLNFLGKSYAKLLASIDTTTVIQPDLEHNRKPENANSENIYISGDNLDGLKHLLKSYAGKVKCIYIDPPYNTGSDGFVYNDNFNFTVEELCTKLSIGEEQATKILDLTKRGSASHSAWLMFIYPRLQLAKDLLTDDGVIFISIDDNEQANLKLLCDNVFGEENFIAELPRITKKAGKTTDTIARNTDYILCYRKSELSQFNSYIHNDTGYKHSDEYIDERGFYKLSQTLDYGSIQYSQSLDYEIDLDGVIFRPGGVSAEDMILRQKRNPKSDFCWRWSKDLFKFGFEKGFIVVKGNRIYTKTYQKATISKSGTGYVIDYSERTKSATTLDYIENEFSNDNSKKDLAKLFDTNVFEYSKPVSLLRSLVYLTTNNNDIILDFFSGSATTAQAVMQINAEYTGNRKFILIQLPETVKTGSDAENAGFKTIDQIGQKRIILAAKKIKEESPLTTQNLDFGFKHYTLLEPSENTIDKMEVFNPTTMFANEDILTQFGKESVLETWVVKDGYGFGAKKDPVKLDNYTAYQCGKHLYFVDTELSEMDVVALIDKYHQDPKFNPENLVIFGYSFTFTQTEMLRKNIAVLKDSSKNLKPNIDVRY